MKKIFITLLLACYCCFSQAQTINDLLKAADQILNGTSTQPPNNNTNGGSNTSGQPIDMNENGSNNQTGNQNTTRGSNNGGLGGLLGGLLGNGLSNSEITGGLKEALQIGARQASSELNVKNGFFGNQLIKILLPPEAQKVESTLRGLGMNRMCDNLIMSLNRAAEDAAGKAVPIFISAITSMSITDGLNILRGGNNAATNFLKGATTVALTQAFKPVIEKSLGKVNATKYWSTAFNTYNKLPLSRNKVNPDLTGYVTERALNGLFVKVSEQEANIRNNPAAQVTSLLQKVFGGK
jgi:hypothetical protein